MIIIDYSQVAIASLFAHLGKDSNVEEDLLRHIILNVIRSNRMKFKEKFGELVIACDDRHYWRKTIFPYYKANRAKMKEKSPLDWDSIMISLNKIRDELKEYFPYKIITVPEAEADDIIAVLCKEYHSNEEILILSTDYDFKQLHKYTGVFQYSPLNKKWITCDDPAWYLEEHIIRGDTGDGVANVLSPDNCLVIGERQATISKKKLEEIISNKSLRETSWYSRNQQLINFDYIPENIKKNILDEYANCKVSSRNKLFSYFMTFKLKGLTEQIGDF